MLQLGSFITLIFFARFLGEERVSKKDRFGSELFELRRRALAALLSGTPMRACFLRAFGEREAVGPAAAPLAPSGLGCSARPAGWPGPGWARSLQRSH